MLNYDMASEELEEKRMQNLLQEGIEKGLLEIKGQKITYKVLGKTYIYSHPEEVIRAVTYMDLIMNYGYPENRIDLEVVAPRREPKLPSDIVVYEDDQKEKVYVVVEAKADATRASIIEAKREGLGNSNLLVSKYLLIVCGPERLAFDVQNKPSLTKLDECRIADLPKKYGKIPKYRFKKGDSEWGLKLASYKVLSGKFQLCHDEIWEGGRRDPAVAFDEMSKLMFAKIYDERFTPSGQYYRFQIGTHESPDEVSTRIISKLYNEAQKREPDVFKTDIELPSSVIFRVVETLQDAWLTKIDLDIKGRAFENFLGRLFRGEYGQYFTRREIVEFMVSVLNPDERSLVMDPACGSGGFLLYTLKMVTDTIESKFSGDNATIARLSWDFAHKQIYGIEINDRVARIAMMDMVIHDDGHTNIECHDALDEFSGFDPRKDIRPGRYSHVLTNPPFGAVVKDKDILGLFKLGKGKNSQRTEVLFLERCLELLGPNGLLGIVLPDGVLANTSLKYVRDYLNEQSRIIGVVSLPQTTFVPAGSGVKASLLFLKKKSGISEDLGEYPIFMAIAEHVGYDATGKPDTNDLPEILSAFRKFLEDNNLA